MDDLENPINTDWFHGKSHLEMDDFAMGNLQIHSNPPRPRFSSPQRPPQNLGVVEGAIAYGWLQEFMENGTPIDDVPINYRFIDCYS